MTNPNSLIWSLPASPVNPWDGIVPNASQSYWKCSGNTVVEMSQAEKDALDAPLLAEQARQQAFRDEVANNDLCNAELSILATKADVLKAANQADINAVSNIATAKATLTNMNNRYDSVLRKIVRCVRARSH